MPATVIHSEAVGGDLALVLPEFKSWIRVPHLVKLNAVLVCLLCYSGTLGYDSSMMNGLQSLTQWQIFMNHPRGAWLGSINAVQALGGLITYPIEAYCADRYGRKPCLYIGTVFVMLGAGIQAAATSPAMFIAARFIIGISTVWFTVAALLITEIAYPTHRAQVTAMYCCQFFVGALLSAWITYEVRGLDSSWAWRIPSLLQAGIPCIAILGTLVAPESPRWLIANGRQDEAHFVLTKFHAGGDSKSPLVQFEIAEIEKAIELERQHAKSTGYSDMVKTKGNRHRLFISISLGIISQWSGNGIVSYYLSLILTTVGLTSVKQQTLVNVFLQLWNLILALGAALLVDRLGRRKLFLASATIMLFSYICITGLSGAFANTGIPSVGIAVIPFLFIFYGGYDIAITPFLISYPAEIWTFALRARGVAVALFTSNVAVLFNLFINPIALDRMGWKYYIVYVVILIGVLITIWLAYPETRGHSLEEMAYIFDGEDSSVPSRRNILKDGPVYGTFSEQDDTTR